MLLNHSGEGRTDAIPSTYFNLENRFSMFNNMMYCFERNMPKYEVHLRLLHHHSDRTLPRKVPTDKPLNKLLRLLSFPLSLNQQPIPPLLQKQQLGLKRARPQSSHLLLHALGFLQQYRSLHVQPLDPIIAIRPQDIGPRCRIPEEFVSNAEDGGFDVGCGLRGKGVRVGE